MNKHDEADCFSADKISDHINDPDLASILRAFDIKIPAKLHRRAELKSLKTGIIIFKQVHIRMYIMFTD